METNENIETGTEVIESLSSEKFNELIRCLTNLKEVCNDADIRGGILRQRTNNHFSVFEIDLRSIFGESNIALTNLKQKLELLKMFQGQEVEITMTEPTENSSGSYNFKDEYSSINFVAPTLDFMDNKYMTSDELENIFPVDEDLLIFENSLSQIMSDRIKVVSQYFSIETILVKFNGETASISASTAAKDQSAKFIDGIILNDEIDQSSTMISNVAFSMDHDSDINYILYKDPNQSVALNKFQTEIGDIDVTVFSRSQIVEIDED